MNILSIQSSVAYGHVGNAAAVFPLQRLGAEVWPIHTVQFSNHPGYGSHEGQVFAPEAVAALVAGVEARGVFPLCDALLSGYIGNAGTGGVIRAAAERIHLANPRALWCCDPVMGDSGPGLYVHPDIPDFFRNQAMQQADILTPNQFELEQLTGLDCRTLAEARSAIATLQGRMRPAGPRIVLVTTLCLEDTPENAIDVLAATPGACHRLRTKRLAFAGNGAGDAMAALFLFHVLQTGSAPEALSAAASAIHGLIRRTVEEGSRELLTVLAQEEFVSPGVVYEAQSC